MQCGHTGKFNQPLEPQRIHKFLDFVFSAKGAEKTMQ